MELPKNSLLENYFDYAASSPCFQEALDEYSHVARTYYGNPSSTHESGKSAKDFLTSTKKELSSLLGFTEGYCIQTSGGTEANNLVIRGVMEKYPKKRLLLAADVHASAWFAAEMYKKRVDILPIEKDGSISIESIKEKITQKTILCSVLHGNNETGTIHNVAEIGRICSEKNIFFHCDGAQIPGHTTLDCSEIPFDFYTFSSHKFGGPRGCGGVLTRRSDFAPQILGGGQEMNLRAGTEPVTALAATVAALKQSLKNIQKEEKRLRFLARQYVDAVCSETGEIVINSGIEKGIPGLLSLSFSGLKGSEIVTEMDLLGFAVSAGSACHSGEIHPSRIIKSRGIPDNIALGTVRISLGRYTTKETVTACAAALSEVVKRQQALR